MHEKLIKQLRELASIPEHCDNVESCDGCSKEDICLSFTNERIIETATKAADAIEALEIKAETFKSAYIAEHNARIDEIKRHMPLPEPPKAEEGER